MTALFTVSFRGSSVDVEYVVPLDPDPQSITWRFLDPSLDDVVISDDELELLFAQIQARVS